MADKCNAATTYSADARAARRFPNDESGSGSPRTVCDIRFSASMLVGLG